MPTLVYLNCYTILVILIFFFHFRTHLDLALVPKKRLRPETKICSFVLQTYKCFRNFWNFINLLLISYSIFRYSATLVFSIVLRISNLLSIDYHFLKIINIFVKYISLWLQFLCSLEAFISISLILQKFCQFWALIWRQFFFIQTLYSYYFQSSKENPDISSYFCFKTFLQGCFNLPLIKCVNNINVKQFLLIS